MKVNEKYYHIIILTNQNDKSYHKYRITYNYTIITNKNIFIKHKIIPHLLLFFIKNGRIIYTCTGMGFIDIYTLGCYD